MDALRCSRAAVGECIVRSPLTDSGKLLGWMSTNDCELKAIIRDSLIDASLKGAVLYRCEADTYDALSQNIVTIVPISYPKLQEVDRSWLNLQDTVASVLNLDHWEYMSSKVRAVLTMTGESPPKLRERSAALHSAVSDHTGLESVCQLAVGLTLLAGCGCAKRPQRFP